MLSYEKCKELKDAGFPQATVGWGYLDKTDVAKFIVMSDGPILCICPTLEELIEACGRKFRKLVRWSDTLSEAYSRTGYVCEGEAPVEAVANLWLALNKGENGA